MNERECFSRSLQVVWFAVQTSQLYPNDQPYLLCLGLLLVPGWALWPQEGHWWGRKLREGGRGWPLGAAPAEPAFDSAALLLTIQRVFHLLLSSVPNLYFCASPGGCLLLQCWSPGTTDPKQLQMVLSSSFGANCMYIFFRFNIQIQLIYIFLCWQKLKFSHAFSRVTVCILDCTEVTKQGNQTSPVVDAVLLSVNQP